MTAIVGHGAGPMGIETLNKGIDLMLDGAYQYAARLRSGAIERDDPTLLACADQANLLLRMAQWALLDPSLTVDERTHLEEAERKLIVVNRLLTNDEKDKENKNHVTH